MRSVGRLCRAGACRRQNQGAVGIVPPYCLKGLGRPPAARAVSSRGTVPQTTAGGAGGGRKVRGESGGSRGAAIKVAELG